MITNLALTCGTGAVGRCLAGTPVGRVDCLARATSRRTPKKKESGDKSPHSKGGMPAVKKKQVRAGIVGAGFSARFHFEAIHKVHGTDVDVVGVYAIDGEQGRGVCPTARDP